MKERIISLAKLPFYLIVGLLIIIHTVWNYGIEDFVFIDTKAALIEFEKKIGLSQTMAILIGISLWSLVVKLIF